MGTNYGDFVARDEEVFFVLRAALAFFELAHSNSFYRKDTHHLVTGRAVYNLAEFSIPGRVDYVVSVVAAVSSS